MYARLSGIRNMEIGEIPRQGSHTEFRRDPSPWTKVTRKARYAPEGIQVTIASQTTGGSTPPGTLSKGMLADGSQPKDGAFLGKSSRPESKMLNIACLDNRDELITFNGFSGFLAPIFDSGALPCVITERALGRIPVSQRPQVHTVHAPLQTVSGHIEHPIGETEPVEIQFTDRGTKRVVK